LLFAVGTGVLGYYIRSWAWAHLVLSLTIAGAVVLVGYEVDPIVWTKFRPSLDGVAG
jgi:hypothetical protein